MSLNSCIHDLWSRFQGELFPNLEEIVGIPDERHRRFVAVLDMVRPEFHVGCYRAPDGRPPAERAPLARAFMAKAVWDVATTRALIERIHLDPALRRLCGWHRRGEIPSESTFSRAFAAFAGSELPSRMHEALIAATLGEKAIVGHISRDSTAISARERPKPKSKEQAKQKKRKRGRPKKGEEREPKPKSLLERQAEGGMTPGRCRPACRSSATGARSATPRVIPCRGTAGSFISTPPTAASR